MDERTLIVSFGKNQSDTNWKNESLTWSEFVGKLKFRRTRETMAAYAEMNDARRGKVKDGPAFVGGMVRDGRRKIENVEYRDLITLDSDHGDENFIPLVEIMIGGTAYAIYSTHSHRPERPRYRIVLPASRAMAPDEHGAVARKIATWFGMEYFDKTTFDLNRLMYLPSCSKDAEPVLVIGEGDPIDVDKVLAEYGDADWRDPLQWPRHPSENQGRPRTGGKKAEDPREKSGIIGAFCRVYGVSRVLDELLADVYEPTSDPHRYTYKGGSSYGGLIIYDDYDGDTFAFSHHESDPISGRLVNAWDLVRMHCFRDCDEGITEDDIEKLPSQARMKEFANQLNEVRLLLQEESTALLQAEFGDSFDSENSKEKAANLVTLKFPSGYRMIGGKIYEVKELKNDTRLIPVCDYIIRVSSRYLNLTDNTLGLEVTWKNGEWVKTVTDSRSTFLDSRKIINLSDYGLPVHSGNARSLAGYISRFESENEAVLPTKQISNQLGWVKGGFLLGDTFLGEGEIQFLPKDTGDGQTVRGFHACGSVDKTFEILKRVKGYAPVKMAVYAALAAPVLHLWKENPFIFELAGGTSRGKTTALRVAASLYGCPDEQKPGFFKQWNMTRVFVERYAATMNHLPLFVDDTKKASDPRIIPATVYQFCSGQGRGRGSLKGAQSGATWCTVLLTTGESKLTSFSKDGGAVGRILSLNGSPFGTADADIGSMIEDLNRQLSENYGHLGEPWIRYLMGKDAGRWKEKVKESNDRYRRLASGGGEVIMRLSRLMAILDVVGQMFDDCFGLHIYSPLDLSREWINLLEGTTEADRASEALEAVMGWVASRQRQFIIGDNGGLPYGINVLGRIKDGEIAIISEQLDEFLGNRGYEPVAIAKLWKEKGWLNTEENRTKKKVRIGGALPRAYCFNLDKVGWAFTLAKDYSEFGKEDHLAVPAGG